MLPFHDALMVVQFGPDGYKDILRYEEMPLHPFGQFINKAPDSLVPTTTPYVSG